MEHGVKCLWQQLTALWFCADSKGKCFSAYDQNEWNEHINKEKIL